MRSHAAAVIILLALWFDPGLGVTCRAAVGNGSVDDGPPLQRCLDSDSEEIVELRSGAEYRISHALVFEKSKRLSGGADDHGVRTSIGCLPGGAGKRHVLRVGVKGELEVRGIRLGSCFSGVETYGNLTLVDSILGSFHRFAVLVRPGGSLTMRRSMVLDTKVAGIAMKGGRLVMLEGSKIVGSTVGVDVGRVKAEVDVELHSSLIRDSEDVAIRVQGGQPQLPVRLLLGEMSSLRNSSRCVGLYGTQGSVVTLQGGSQLYRCRSAGILVRNGESNTVVMQGGSQITATLTAIMLDQGLQNKVAMAGGSSIRRSDRDAVLIRQGTSHQVALSGGSWIEHSGGCGVQLERGRGHIVVIAGDSSLHYNQYGVMLTESPSSLRVENSAIRQCGRSAIHIRSAQGSTGTVCTSVTLQGAYLVHNSQGFWCDHTCALGEASGVFYFNGEDFHNDCSGGLTLRQGPLSATGRFGALKAATQWCTLCTAVALAIVPWLQVLPVYYQPSGLRNCWLRLGVLAWATASALVSVTWARRALDICAVVHHLKGEDLEEEEVKPLLTSAVAAPLLAVCASLTVRRWWLRRRRAAEVLQLIGALEESLWQGDAWAEVALCAKLEARGLSRTSLGDRVQELRRQQSQEAGVSVAYLLSPDFLELARARTGLENPTFLQMKDPFWGREDALGKLALCPRDGRPGCALVDTLRPQYRRRCTHFLSWVWRYPVLLVREALQIWTEEEGLDPSSTFLFMCFFVNNQFRIFIEGTQGGSDDLETTFERNLQRIGRVVALLDHWQRPVYLSRAWTIYEQFVAAKLHLPVTVILNQMAGESLVAELDKGSEGIMRITGTLCEVHSEMAVASAKSDEEHLKALIRSSIGFGHVDQRVRNCMMDWVAAVVHRRTDRVVQDSKTLGAVAARPGLVRSVLCVRLQRAANSMSAMEIEGP